MSKLKTNRLLELETKPRHNAIYIYLYNIIFFLKIKLNFNGDVMVRIKLHIVRCWVPLSSTPTQFNTSVPHKIVTPFQPKKFFSSTPKTPRFNTPLRQKLS